MDEVNGGGWGCIYSHQPLPSRWAILLSADGPPSWCGRSAPVDQRLKMQRSAVTAISTAILHLMRRQMSDKVRRGRSGRLARTVREAAIIHFSEPVTFGFFGSSPTGRSAPEAGRFAQGHGLSDRGLSSRAPETVHEDAKIAIYRTSSGFFWFFNERTVRT